MFKKKQKQTENKEIVNRGKDYRVYTMTKTDWTIARGIGFGIGFIVSWIFFSNFVFALICGVAGMLISPKFYRNYKQKKEIDFLRDQFKDLLDSLSTSYSAGKNTVSAFEESLKDMIAIYGENAYIVKEVEAINGGLKNNINIETLLLDFAERSGLEDVRSFADVFEVCNRKGGNLKKIVTQTRDIISEKMEIEMEIDTLLAGNKNELNIMMVMPLIIVFMLNGLGTGTVNANTFRNIALKLFCIALFGVAYYLGKKLTDIKI